MRNAGQAGIKTAGRNINNLRYADDTTLMAEREDNLEPLDESLSLCGSQQTVDNSSRDGDARPLNLSPEKSVFRSRSNS